MTKSLSLFACLTLWRARGRSLENGAGKSEEGWFFHIPATLQHETNIKGEYFPADPKSVQGQSRECSSFFFFLNTLEMTEMRAFSGSWEFSFCFPQMGGFGWAQPISVLAQLSIAVLKWDSLLSAERYTHHRWAHHQVSMCTSSWMSSLVRLHGGLSVAYCIRYKAIPIGGESGKMVGHHLDSKQ